MNIVFCTDTNYIMPSSVLIKSISLNNKDKLVDFYAVIDESVTEKDMNILECELEHNSKHKINFLRVNGDAYQNMPNLGVSKEKAKKGKITATHTTKACYYRLSLADLMPETVDKVLYFDCDTVILQNLTKLWNTDLEGKAVAAAIDEGELDMNYDQLGFSSEYGYFNSGVMIIDLAYWRKHNMFEKFLRIIKEHEGRMRQHDQEILNIAFYNNVKRIPMKYNFQEDYFKRPEKISNFYAKYSKEIEDSLRDITILHYTAYKPWYKECGQPMKDCFFDYLKRTAWKKYRPVWKNKDLAFNISIYRMLTKLGIKRSQYRKSRSIK
ncbi:MAG: glycosyltransferase family 8 protein [Muribaculaceae bacterium]|nr:glycosyltransferase family 8 protein [Muribaculaceae bacterium]